MLNIITLIIKEQLRNFKDRRLQSKPQLDWIKPYMKNREILLIEELLTKLQPKNCLEWGSGYSTLFFPKYLPTDSNWLSIEHHPEWAEKINELNNYPGVKTVLVPPNMFPWSDAHDDGSYSDLSDYVDYPGDAAPFDFILVDGRSRKECLIRAYEWVSETGVVVLHDSNREYYHQALVNFPYQVLFRLEGREDKGLWFGCKEKSISAYIDVAAHQKLWGFHNNLRRGRGR